MKHQLEQVASQQTKQMQRLILSPQMQQALHLLQLPIMELSTLVEEELSQNPLLEIGEGGFIESPLYQKREIEDLKSFVENTLANESSLFDELMRQAHEHFEDPHSLFLAEALIGNLERDGLLKTPLEEIALLWEATTTELEPILKVIQTFEPFGVGATSLKESLLIQLKVAGKAHSLAFALIESHFEDLLHNRLPSIAKAMDCEVEKIRQTLHEEIAHLDLHPGTVQPPGHYTQLAQPIIPDITLHSHPDGFTIQINDERLPPIRLSHPYMTLLQDPSLSAETRAYIEEKVSSGKWLLRNIQERHHTLYRITEELLKIQSAFFSESSGQLVPLTMKEIAEKLDLHESTIARAISNKYISSTRGLLPLRSFFTHAYQSEKGEAISAETVKDLVKQLIDHEDKRSPLSDEVISQRIREKEIVCARRTVAKYRQELGLGNTAQRRQHV